MNKTISVIGSGRLGKGFVGPVFMDAGWKVSFLDNDPKVIDSLNTNEIQLEIHAEDATYLTVYDAYDAYLLNETNSCTEILYNANLWALALYPADFPKAIKAMVPALKKVLSQEINLSILVFTNKNHFIEAVTATFKEHLTVEEQNKFEKYVEVKDVIIIRSTFASSNASLEIQTAQTMNSLVEPLKFSDITDVSWLEERENIEQLKTAKLFALNSWHAAAAYTGWYRNIMTINETFEDSFCLPIIQAVKKKSGEVLQKEFLLSEEEISVVQTLINPKEPIEDSVQRVACDPVRKLGSQDRLVYPAKLCVKYDLDFQELAQVIALAFLYEDDNDYQAREIKDFIEKNSIEQAVNDYCDIKQGTALHNSVCTFYAHFKEERN